MLYMPFYLGDAILIQEYEVHLYVYPNGLEPLKHFGQELYHQEFSLQIFLIVTVVINRILCIE